MACACDGDAIIGETIVSRATVEDPDTGGLVTPTSAVLRVVSPDGSMVVPDPTISNPSTGIYEGEHDVDAVGTWCFSWTIIYGGRTRICQKKVRVVAGCVPPAVG